MKAGFYPKLAVTGIRKNKRMYFPYVITCTAMVMMTYIINYLKEYGGFYTGGGGSTVRIFMNLGSVVLTVFSVIFLFYTNSFLIRRRKKEFGLYNILGMNKGNISRILLWETLLVALCSISLGLAGGIAFSKLAEVAFINILHKEVDYRLSVSVPAVLYTAACFGTIFVLLLLNSLRQVRFSTALRLLRSENLGEKPPKANWFLGVLGVAVLGAAYYLAITTKNPISAIGVFMVAVVMVVVATYLIMIAGSVLMCRILQKRKNYYYKANHFVSVSSMAYRMKRNGAGLASICILATMVLVMVSSTTALYVGIEDVLSKRYPREVNTSFRMYENKTVTDADKAVFQGEIDKILEKHGVEPENVLSYRETVIAGVRNGGDIIYDTNAVYDFSIGTYNNVMEFYMISLEDYNRIMGESKTLAADEALIYAYRTQFTQDTIAFQDVHRYRVQQRLEKCFLPGNAIADIVPSMVVVVPDLEKASEGLTTAEGTDLANRSWRCCFDVPAGADATAIADEIKMAMRDLQLGGMDTFISSAESREANRVYFYEMYGGLFYLGILLSIVFLCAAVLIIYYKQISEGYEDQTRFQIMQKVGMTKKDIRRSINSQLLTVFFLPLGMACLHLAFALPIMEELLQVFALHNHTLFIGTTLGSILVFAIFYVFVYRKTAKAYYQIVSE